MSRSFRTEPKRRIAARNVPRDADGRARLPRIVARQPRQGDVHPLPKRLLTRLLAGLPLELWHGLTRIELRAREGEVGRPFASYHPRDRSIRLHSLPMEFHLPPVSRGTVKLLEGFGAEVEATTDGHRV
ncbi:MAG TPA: hypothetical protein PKE47_07920, partial [Verrucomicrobiota bacterium]|nr:hypothetical protein [Verrucomicrobiota bacterium]